MQIGLTTRLGIDANYRAAVSRVAESAQLDDTELAKLQASLREINYLPQLREAVLSERAYGAQAFEGRGPMFETPAGEMIEGEEDLADYGMMDDRPVWWWTFTSHLDEWQYWRTMRRMCDATNEKDFQLIARGIRDADEELSEVAGRSDFFAARYKVSRDTAQSIYWLKAGVTTAVAMNRAVDALLACERFRLAQGKYPESLDQLVPQYLPSVLIDAFDGKELKYRRDGEEILVYSVGLDGIDNQGRPPNPNGHVDVMNGSDIGFRSHDWKRSYEEMLANPISEAKRIGVDYDFGLDDDVN
jgi:hypothetical protein